MSISRRKLVLLAPAIAAAQSGSAEGALPSATFSFDKLAVTEGKTTRIRQMLKGKTHAGFPIDVHVTELAPGEMPHPPHRHLHEELLLIREGELDVTVGGRTTRLGPGSVTYLASNDEHGWRNVGSTPAQYFVMALGDDV